MPCVLTGSQLLDCKDSVGGIRELKIKVHPGATVIANDFTVTSGTVTIASGSRSLWYTYGIEKETSSWNDDPQPNVQNGTLFWQETLKLILNKMSARLHYEINLLGQARLLVALRDMNNQYWLMGYEFGTDLTAGTAGTGAARGDRNGYDLTFMAKERVPAPNMSAATWDTLVT